MPGFAASLTRNIRVVHSDPAKLILRVRCHPAGYQCGYVRLRPRVFDCARELDVEVDEYPSMRSVPSRGWDLHKYEQRMAVPSFTAYLDGRDLGDVWFDVPNYLDHRRGVLDTEFGFRVDHEGEVELRLEIVAHDRNRFRWDMVETLKIGPDDRKEAALAPRANLRRDKTWLFLAGRSVEEIRRDFAATEEFSVPMSYLEQLVRDYDGIPPEQRDLTKKPDPTKKVPPAYYPLDQVTAGAALATGSPLWKELARATLRRLAFKPTWARDNFPPRLMGGDNDMVIGHPLLSLSMLYHYLREELSADERSAALAKAHEYGTKLYDFSVLQKRYATGMGHIMSHESNPLLGLGVCAMVFWDEIPDDAPRWLAWAHGRMLAGATDAPRDGRNPWTTYGPNFLTFYACAVKDFAGEDMFRIPYFRNLGAALIRGETIGARRWEYNLRWIMAALWAYTDMPEAAWEWRDLWKALSEHRGNHGTEHYIGWQDMLWRPPRDRARPPSPRLRKSFLFKDTGLALLRTADEPATLACYFQSGLAVGRAGFKHRKRYSMEHHDAGADGGVTIYIRGTPLVGSHQSGYRRGFRFHSVVTVDGAGHYMDDRVLGTRILEPWISRMISFRDDAKKTVAEGDNTGAYREELGVKRSRRRVTLDKRSTTLALDDHIELSKPRRVATKFNCPSGTIRQLSKGRYRIESTAGEQLDVVVDSPARYRIRMGQGQLVLGYAHGFNVKKGKRTHSVVKFTPPRPRFLEVAMPGKVKRAKFRVSFRPVEPVSK